ENHCSPITVPRRMLNRSFDTKVLFLFFTGGRGHDAERCSVRRADHHSIDQSINPKTCRPPTRMYVRRRALARWLSRGAVGTRALQLSLETARVGSAGSGASRAARAAPSSPKRPTERPATGA